MRRTVGVGVVFVVAGLAVWFWVGRTEPPEPDASADTDAVEPAGAPVLADNPAAPLTLLPAEVDQDRSVEHGALRGRVISWADGRGIVGAEVTFAHDGATHMLQSDGDGGFELVAPEPGRYELAVVSAEGYLPFAPEWGHSPVVFHTRPGQRITGIRVHLTPALAYRGRVENPAGEPVAGATVRVVGDQGAGMALAPALEPVASGARGEFAIAAPDYALLEASHPEWTPGRAPIDFAAQVSRTITIRLGAAADLAGDLSISGRVLAADGNPIDGALVEARYAAPNPAAPEAQLRTTGRAATGEDGTFVVAGLDAGIYALGARARGHAPAYRPVVRAGAEGIELRLGVGLSIRGAVTDADTGAAVPTFSVLLSPARGRQRLESVLDAAGEYLIGGLGPGPVRVRVAAYGYATSTAKNIILSANDDPAVVDFELSAGGRVHGVVIDEVTREPLPGARVSCETGVGAREVALPIAASALTDARGEFDLRGVAGGLRSLVVAAAAHHGRIISGLEVEEDGDIGPVTVELAPVAEGDQPRLELTGIGAVLSPHEGGYVIGETLEGGGAAGAGLVSGDLILAIDGTPVGELEFVDAIEMIRGVEGTTLTLTVRRSSGQEIEVEATRRRVRR